MLIGHGSRDPQGQRAFLDFAQRLQHLWDGQVVEPCFLELCPPTIGEAVDRCVQRGAREIVAVPLLLFAARHHKYDIQHQLDHAKSQHPLLRVHSGQPLGLAPEMLGLARHRVGEAVGAEADETVVVVAGRGSSDPDANGDVCKMARLLYEGSGLRAVETCYIGITHPRLEEGIRRALLLEPRRVVVLPWLLFPGRLLDRVHRVVDASARRWPSREFRVAREIGPDPSLAQLVLRRAEEAAAGEVRMNCDVCKFRMAAGLPHGHSHETEAAHALSDPAAYHQRA